MGDHFNKWKNYGLNKVDNSKNLTEQAFLKSKADFEAFVDRAKDVNNARCFKHFQELNTKNVFKAWFNAIKHLKLVKAKTVEFK